MHFYTDALANATFADFAENVDKVRDNNLRTYWDRTAHGGSFSFSWTSGAVHIDAMLLLCQGVGEWAVSSGGQRVFGDGKKAFIRLLLEEELQPDGTRPEFVMNGTTLTVTVPTDGKLYEVYALKRYKSIGREQRPMRYRRIGADPRTSAYFSESSELISYGGLSPGGKYAIQIGWDYMPEDYYYFLDELERAGKYDEVLLMRDGLEDLQTKFLRVELGKVRNSSNSDYKYTVSQLNGFDLARLTSEYSGTLLTDLDELRSYLSLLNDDLLALRAKYRLEVSKGFVTIDDFERLFLGVDSGRLREPFFIYPEPKNRPNEAYRVYWNNEFEPYPSVAKLDRQRNLLVGQGGSIRTGYTLDINLLET